jgi:membrane peptidoglycan carboxypeptidase
MPLTACQSMMDSAPIGLVPKLKGMRFAGSFAVKGSARFDTANLDRTFKVDWDVTNSCRVTEAPPDINVERLRHAFRHTVYTPDGKPTEMESGPETPDWVSESHISKFMEVAVQTTEDGGFQRHHGFDHEAIRNSIRENIREKKFVRGASTISMQLAKNLYLDRTKNISRKLQEAVLTMYLEQELTKEQILELYLNVVEFGPMIYGIGPASRYYFNTPASELSLGQALYISSIMPNPKVSYFGAGGAVSQRRMSYLHKLMHIAFDRHRITDEELDDGLRETLVRGSPPERAPKGSHLDDKTDPRSRSGDGRDDEPAADPDWIAP